MWVSVEQKRNSKTVYLHPNAIAGSSLKNMGQSPVSKVWESHEAWRITITRKSPSSIKKHEQGLWKSAWSERTRLRTAGRAVWVGRSGWNDRVMSGQSGETHSQLERSLGPGGGSDSPEEKWVELKESRIWMTGKVLFEHKAHSWSWEWHLASWWLFFPLFAFNCHWKKH